MFRILAICEVLCISGMIGGCDVGGDRLSEPLDAAVQSLSTPTPSVGIIPATGWAPDGAPTVHTCNGDGTVTFHGGVWVTPVAARQGDSLADVAFTIEAPTGHTGDPTTVIVELFSSQSASVLGQISLTPFGSGVRVNGDIPLSPARVVASGETFQLVFVPLAGGDYATNDTKIDTVRLQSTLAATRSVTMLPVLSYNLGTWGAIDRWADANGRIMIATASVSSAGSGRINIPHGDGDVIASVTAIVSGNGVSDAAFQLERFNIGISGGFAALGQIVIDNNRGNIWSSIQIPSSQVALSSSDVVYLNMAPTPGADIGYRVGGIVVNFN